jgi:uncharacterized iron-regulated membrane protein
VTTETRPENQPPAQAAARRVGLRKPRRRTPVKRATTWLHRWLSLVLGVVLVVECTTGSLLVYEPELDRWLRGDTYADAGALHGETLQQSYDAAAAAYPDLTFDTVIDDHGTHVVTDYDASRSVTVEARTGDVLGAFDSEGRSSGWVGWALGFSDSLHECAFTCEGMIGYQAWLSEPVPKVGDTLGIDDGGESYPVTWGGLILGVLGLLLVFLALTGIWLWWPTTKHFRRGLRVRFGKNRYARDYDLHQVVGMIAIPLLLMWGLTGMSYELGFVEKGWYAATPGSKTDDPVLDVDDEATAEIGWAEAVTAAEAASGVTGEPTEVDVPVPDDPTGSWSVWFQAGFDPYGNSPYPGNRLVQVDRHDASNALVTYGGAGEPKTQAIYNSWNYPIHSGFAFNGWIRIVWFVLGLVPVLLMWTGISTWLFKRATRKRRRRTPRVAAA